ncbi:MAG: addiction module protein [Desulfococcaceae bacterium]
MVAINIHKLSRREQLELFEELWEAIRHRAESEPDFLPLTDAQNAELDRRLDEMDQGDLSGESFKGFLERVRNRDGV